MVNSNTSTEEPQDDSKFRENLRSQLQESEARSASWYREERERLKAERDKAELDRAMSMPFARTALIWIGGVFGTLLFTFGLFWFLSFLGVVFPWYVAFSLLIMLIGGALIVAAATRPKRRVAQ
jgi:hypothetical protein